MLAVPSQYRNLAHYAMLLLAMLGFGGCAAQLKHMDGLYRLETGEYAEGVKDLQLAMELDPANTRLRADWLQKRDQVTEKLLKRAQQAMLNNQPDEARKIYEAIQSYSPDNARAADGLILLARQVPVLNLLKQANDALKQGDRTQATTLVNRVLASTPELAEAKALKRQIDELDAREMLTSPSLSNLYRKPITLEFRDASLKMVFEALSKSTGINFILDRDIRSDQRTTVFLKQSSLEDALDVLAATNQLDKKVLNSSSVLVYPNTPAKLKEYQDLVVRAFYLHGASAKDTANLIKTILKLKDIFVDDKLNMLVVRDTPETIALTEKLVSLYDLDEPEVMLEVEVLEVARSRLLDLGIEVTDRISITPLGVSTDSSGTKQPQSLSTLLHLNQASLGATPPSVNVNFHQENGDVSLLANPRIRVRNRDKARIQVGEKIPIVSATTSNLGYVSETIQYQDVGLKLDVEPTIYSQDEIAIKMGLDVSSLGKEVKTKSGTVAYQIGSRSAETVLRLHDGETQVLAGLIDNQERSSASGLPGLSSLPILGHLFSGQSDSKSKSEIVLSITPHLIRGIRRKEPDAEMFWSGTDAVLRAKPLQLRIQGEVALPAKPVPAANAETKPSIAVAPAAKATEPAPAEVSPIKLSWQGADKLKVGDTVNVTLNLASTATLRGLPLQLGFDPKRVEIVSVTDGGYFGSKANFSQTIDKASGRIAVALGTSSEQPASSGKLLTLQIKALAAGPASLELTGAIPVASGQVVARPVLPLRHAMQVE